jgi:hypothetical protein
MKKPTFPIKEVKEIKLAKVRKSVMPEDYYKRPAAYSNLEVKTENTDMSNTFNDSPDKSPLAPGQQTWPNESPDKQRLGAELSPKTLPAMPADNLKAIEEMQRKRKEEKKLLHEQAEKNKENAMKNLLVKPLQEKIEETQEESVSDSRDEEIKTKSPEQRNELKDINQFDFSKLVAPRRPTLIKKEDLTSVRILPKPNKM